MQSQTLGLHLSHQVFTPETSVYIYPLSKILSLHRELHRIVGSKTADGRNPLLFEQPGFNPMTSD